MKRLSVFSLLLFLCISAGAQHYQLIESFKLAAAESVYGIFMDIDPDGQATMLVDMAGPNDSQQTRLIIPSTRVEQFLRSINQAKDYFLKWKGVALNGDLKLFSKDIPVRFSDLDMFFTSDGKWFKEKGVDLHTRFYVDDEGKCFLVLDTDYLTSEEEVEHGVSYGIGIGFGGLGIGKSSMNLLYHYYCPGASLFFSSEDEIDFFVEKIKNAVKWKKSNIEIGKFFK